MHLYLAPDGDVRACCRNWEALGNIGTQRLTEIWDGVRRQELVSRLAADDFSFGCQQCDAEVAVEGRLGSYRANFDRFAPLPPEGSWPLRMEFNVSNACNLQCVQCNGFLSSSIRTHREQLPPLPKVYGEPFFEDLRQFIPHLREAQFAGGEPFLASENFRIWDLIEELSPGLPCTVVTNATQWTPRIERLLESHRMGFAFSIDGATKETYESIRIGADFDEVIANIDRYTEHARRAEMTASFNFCLMAENFRELHLMLRMAEERHMAVDVSVVRSPGRSCVAHLPQIEIRRGLEELRRHDAKMSQLSLNGRTWSREMERLEHWASLSDEDREYLWYDAEEESRSPQRVSIRRRLDEERVQPDPERVLGFLCAGAGPTDDITARETLSSERPIMHLTVAKEDVVVECDPTLAEFAASGGKDLVGGPAMEFLTLLVDRYGELSSFEEVARSDDWAEVRVQFSSADATCIMVPLRDESGWATQVRLLVAITGR